MNKSFDGLRLVIIGANGQVARALRQALKNHPRAIFLRREDLDLGNVEPIPGTLRRLRPDIVINAAAYTHVDRAEAEPELALKLNAYALEKIGAVAQELGAFVVHYSTNYVFDGIKSSPYTEEDAANPQSAYGRSKLKGEELLRGSAADHVILRLSSIYGNDGENFLVRMRSHFGARKSVQVVRDQIQSPTSSYLVAAKTVEILRSLADKPRELWPRGTFHLTSLGSCSWYEFARHIYDTCKPKEGWVCQEILPIKSSEWPSKVQRPANGVLQCDLIQKTFGITLPSWQDNFSTTILSTK